MLKGNSIQLLISDSFAPKYCVLQALHIGQVSILCVRHFANVCKKRDIVKKMNITKSKAWFDNGCCIVFIVQHVTYQIGFNPRLTRGWLQPPRMFSRCIKTQKQLTSGI